MCNFLEVLQPAIWYGNMVYHDMVWHYGKMEWYGMALTVTFVSFAMSGCAGQLSIIRQI